MYKLKLSRREKRELALSKWLLVILAVIGVAITIWLAWIRPAQQNAAIDSFEECKVAGNMIQESYPEVCLTKDGKRFVNPEQAQAREQSQAESQRIMPPADTSALYLDIKEWGIQVPLTAKTFDLTYAYLEDGLQDRVTFTFKRLVQAGICAGDAGVTLTRNTAKNQPPYNVSNPEPVAQVGNYYYYIAYAGSPCYDTENAEANALVAQIVTDKSLAQTIGELLMGIKAE